MSGQQASASLRARSVHIQLMFVLDPSIQISKRGTSAAVPVVQYPLAASARLTHTHTHTRGQRMHILRDSMPCDRRHDIEARRWLNIEVDLHFESSLVGCEPATVVTRHVVSSSPPLARRSGDFVRLGRALEQLWVDATALWYEVGEMPPARDRKPTCTWSRMYGSRTHPQRAGAHARRPGAPAPALSPRTGTGTSCDCALTAVPVAIPSPTGAPRGTQTEVSTAAAHAKGHP